MTEHQALRAAIITSPGDDTLRVAYADWLDENEPEDVAEPHHMAEYIRLSCKIAEKDDAWRKKLWSGTSEPFNFSIEKNRIINHKIERSQDPDVVRVGQLIDIGAQSGCFLNLFPAWLGRSMWDRGFVHEFQLVTASEWIEHGDAWFWHPSQNRSCPTSAHPLEVVRLDRFIDIPDRHYIGENSTIAAVESPRWPGLRIEMPHPLFPIRPTREFRLSEEAMRAMLIDGEVFTDAQGNVMREIGYRQALETNRRVFQAFLETPEPPQPPAPPPDIPEFAKATGEKRNSRKRSITKNPNGDRRRFPRPR